MTHLELADKFASMELKLDNGAYVGFERNDVNVKGYQYEPNGIEIISVSTSLFHSMHILVDKSYTKGDSHTKYEIKEIVIFDKMGQMFKYTSTYNFMYKCITDFDFILEARYYRESFKYNN